MIYQIQQAMYLGERDRPKLVVIDESWDLLTLGDAATFMERMYTNPWAKLQPGRCRYGLLLGEDGFIRDGAKALVLRVDSPGGSVMASEEIRTALERFKAGTKDSGRRPVVVSMANLAASGGYWVSTPADRIFAEPGTITGSIGIFAMIPSFERALADYGVKSDGVRSTPLSGQPDILSGLTPEVKDMLQANIESGYGRFVTLVGAARKKSPAEVEAVAEGRAWDGGTARQKGLVDQFGGLDAALADAAQRAKLGDDWHPAFYGEEQDPYASLIEQLRGDDEEFRLLLESFLLVALPKPISANHRSADLRWLEFRDRGLQA